MGFRIGAIIKNKKSARTPDDVALVSFGTRIGSEVFNYKFQASTLESIRGTYKGLMKSGPASKKPFTFSWLPLSDKKPMFPSYSRTPLEIRITVVNQDNGFKWEFSFDDVVLAPGKPDYKDFPGGYRREDQRFDGVFIKFVDDRD